MNSDISAFLHYVFLLVGGCLPLCLLRIDIIILVDDKC